MTNAILSEIFESEKGRMVYDRRTICEVHRDIFDRLVAGLAEHDPTLLREVVPLIEEAYLMGVKMNAKLIIHCDGNDGWSDPNTDVEGAAERRAKRAQILRDNLDTLSRFERRA